MGISWTPAQLNAIDTRNKTLLVSAAAGAGKTAALTERIIRLITAEKDPADISKMLVVTFTRAAAAELRQRIFVAVNDALAKDPTNTYLSQQLVALSSAKICTIDSFYLEVVRQGFDAISISPSFRTADASELDVMAKSIMEETIDELYEKHPEEFSEAVQCFVGLRNSAKLSDIFLKLYSSTESLIDGIDFIKKCAERTESEGDLDFFDTTYGKVMRESAIEQLEYTVSVLDDCFVTCQNNDELAVKYLPSFSYDLTYSKKLLELLGGADYVACRDYVGSYSPLALKRMSKSTEESEAVKDARNELNKKLAILHKKAFNLSPESISSLMHATARILFTVYDLLCEYDRRFSEEKKQKNICSFSDVRRYALQLLVNPDGTPTERARGYAEQFTDIFIDEYQDVDRVQDLIFSSIAKPTARFMVGDIKQSIYRFRGAEPDVFAEYRKKFPKIDEAEGSNVASVFMSENFRCDSSVIKFTNKVCSYIFSSCAESMDYSGDDDLVFKKSNEDRAVPEVPVELSIIVPSDDKDADDAIGNNRTAEARYVACQIAELLKNGKKADGTQIMPEDIAVLFRSKSTAVTIREELAAIGIDTTDNSDGDFFETPEVLLMLCLLNAVDNPQRDVYIAGLLRSPLFDFTMEELVEIRSSSDRALSLYDALLSYKEKDSVLGEKCRAFDICLLEFRDRAISLPVDKLLHYLYSSDLFIANGLINNNENNPLLRLYEYARSYENGSFKGLYNFLAYLTKLRESNSDIASETVTKTPGKVTLMNFHKSKGLEFPVCFICNVNKLFNTDDFKESLILEPSLGIAMNVADKTGLARILTPMREAIIRRTRMKNTEEEMRILYVALTRARERLYISATPRSSEASLLAGAEKKRLFSCDYTIRSSTSYLDWILTSLAFEDVSDYCNISFIKKCDIRRANTEPDKSDFLPDDTLKEEAERLKEELKEKLNFSYRYLEASRLPAKISVSELLPKETKNEENEVAYEPFKERKNQGEYLAPAILRGEDKDAASPTARGTATHLFLQFCDFRNAEKNGVSTELDRLIEKKFIPADSTSLVFRSELEAFFKSDLYAALKKAKWVIREQRFNILLPPSVLNSDERFLSETEGEELAVQGVIDLLFEDEFGDLILCDYKTDRLLRDMRNDPSALTAKMRENHAKQLTYYAEAVKRLFSRECKRILIYSTHAAMAVEI